MAADDKQTIDFGYTEIPRGEKVAKVRAVFDSVAGNYDIMNDLMSLGIHRLWKRHLVGTSAVRPGASVLDLAGGTGDIARLLLKRVGEHGNVVLSDINMAMMREGRDRLIDEGVWQNLEFAQANAEALPFAPNSFDCVTMAFGLRNVTDKQAALNSIFSVLKPGGRCLVLEFSQVQLKSLAPIYDAYSFTVLPQLGQWVAKDRDSYQYLAESIRRHPPQDELQQMMERAGFERCSYRNMNGGIVAIHSGYRI